MEPPAQLDPNSRRVARVLSDRIETGEYSSGEWLPTERELADEFGVHRRVVRSAITALTQEGRLVRRPRCRPLVAARRVRESAATAPLAARSGAGERLVALVMWHGGFGERPTAQQRIFWGFNQALAQVGYHGVFLDLGDEIASEDVNAAREAARLEYAVEQNFAGIVFVPYAYRKNHGLIQQIARRIPLVLVDRQIPGIETDYVGIDNLGAMQEAARHLLAQGHRRVALVSRSEPINTVQDRVSGYRAAMREAGLADAGLVLTVDTDQEWAMFDLLFRQPPPQRLTALLCVNDVVALEVADRLLKLGLHVPEDVALVGFDDLVQELPNGVGLSGVAQPFEEIGAAAARLLRERAETPTMRPRRVELPAMLIVRASSAAPGSEP